MLGFITESNSWQTLLGQGIVVVGVAGGYKIWTGVRGWMAENAERRHLVQLFTTEAVWLFDAWVQFTGTWTWGMNAFRQPHESTSNETMRDYIRLGGKGIVINAVHCIKAAHLDIGFQMKQGQESMANDRTNESHQASWMFVHASSLFLVHYDRITGAIESLLTEAENEGADVKELREIHKANLKKGRPGQRPSANVDHAK